MSDAKATINVQGELFDRIVITVARSSCGNINDGLAFYLHDDHKKQQNAVGVMSWEDFEAAYLTLKEVRSASHSESNTGKE